MFLDPKTFRAYDVRAIYPTQLDEDGIRSTGKAYVKFLQEQNPGKKLSIVVGRDIRLSGITMMEAVVDGITSMGADVIDVGILTTPDFYFAVSKLGYDGGLQVTASHNPKEYNGVKVVGPGAMPIGLQNGLDEIRDMAIAGNFSEAAERGNVISYPGVAEECAQHALKFFDHQIRPLKVVVDTANSVGSIDIEALFAHLPCELVRLNWELDGNFPSHPADPLDDHNNLQLQNKVREVGADLGIAIDGDADRYFFVDETGKTVDQSIIRGILAQKALEMNPGAKILYDIRPGKITRDMIVAAGGVPGVTPVGHTKIKLQAIQEGAPFAGESSGHFFFKTEYGMFETTLIVTLVILDYLSKENTTFSERIKPYQKYFNSGEINSKVSDIPSKLEEIKKLFEGECTINTLDGYYFECSEYWVSVRSSNTEPLLRLIVEAPRKEKMEEIRDKALEVIQSGI